MKPGILYIVPTPIGNLDDMTQRAQQVLASVSAIAAEDTRHSRVLLEHYGITTPMFALHEHNEREKAAGLVARLQGGESIALISDAGTPLISDPGFPLVRACRQAGVQVTALPGPSAVITALSASGLPTDKFLFAGFLPAKQQARVTALEALADETGTMVFYESPRRIAESLSAISEVLGAAREVVVAREISKQYETYLHGSAADVLAKVQADANQQRGEIVLIVAGKQLNKSDIPAEALKLLTELTALLPPKKAAKVVANHYGLRANDLYKLTLKA
ncbi:16S rRNA (cytidine(1402)-2'-O)-methyltransferase [Aliidiomarina taiwanensis]|uniref:Ribosomal RNA small subunit methyltransferase I n=1 Tax=Aliidiomarina taiwanensis TaxID=946228 RepID=A0A432X7N8_9GAMM|nr:16S rRNA (cytidine(1402)-2'-O)-methyltransferase [Aliidiomarina taiwanensis]RUO42879.1 16S rRNA (cytidine(1402)-2'-O)-methyltransferase [Aliidiomarina taiwanensis]